MIDDIQTVGDFQHELAKLDFVLFSEAGPRVWGESAGQHEVKARTAMEKRWHKDYVLREKRR